MLEPSTVAANTQVPLPSAAAVFGCERTCASSQGNLPALIQPSGTHEHDWFKLHHRCRTKKEASCPKATGLIGGKRKRLEHYLQTELDDTRLERARDLAGVRSEIATGDG